MSIVLGLNAFHGDSSACLLVDGQLIAAAEEERFRRIKHWAGFPSEAIRYCLSEAKCNLSDVEHVAINSDPSAARRHKLAYVLRERPSYRLVLERLRNASRRLSIEKQFELAFSGSGTQLRAIVHRVEHHLAHLASAYSVSGFDRAVAVSVDGFGDFASSAWGVGQSGQIAVDERVHFPHSLGIFYQAITQFLGFPHYGDEYKVMGLAPYGSPCHLNKMEQLLHLQADGKYELAMAYFRHGTEKIDYAWDEGAPSVGTLFTGEMENLLGKARTKNDPLTQYHFDLARSAQAMYEKAFFHLLNHTHDRYTCDHLALAGGCAMNSVANGKIRQNTPFKNVYIQSAAGDAGGAIGAAFNVSSTLGHARNDRIDHAYWGPRYTTAQVQRVLQDRESDLAEAGITVLQLEQSELLNKAARAIADGGVVGWFQGRMEWGPRALGNRSIVCDPRRDDMKDILNLKIKRRESFRPFAPSILRECVPDWFEEDDDVPFMMQVFPIREERRSQIPAVTHVDGSGRLQTVDKTTNPLYYGLIQAFEAISDVPMVLNTSFNENEPVVCKPSEALDCFLRTKMDVLVMEDIFLQRASS